MNTSSHHLLVVANQTATNEALVAELRRRQHAGPVVVHLVVAALTTTRARHWLSDIDEATRAAHARVDEALAVMQGAGITLTAEAGDGDPLSAIADALAQFPADEILICTLPV